jgi:N-acetyl-anhydromuramyl-L-alanine amidase AmpD
MLNIKKYDISLNFPKEEVKNQIVLCNTSREIEEYLISLKFRYNGKYNIVPHFVITKNNDIYQLLDEKSNTNMFKENNLNKNKIFISFENLGWLTKKPFSNGYINWKDDIYKGEVFNKKWRNQNYWDTYTEEQINISSVLCLKLMEEFNIDKKFIGHNTKVKDIENFGGVVSRSNFSEIYTDINPSFNFKLFLKNIDYEQYA